MTFYKDYNKKLTKVFEQLIAIYANKMPKQFLPSALNNLNASELVKIVILIQH
jgi:hypothetical protein